MKTILHTVFVTSEPQTVFNALTTQKGNASWWSTSVKAPENSSVDDVIEFTFQEGFNPKMQVTGLKENQRVDWKCIGGSEEWQDNTFSFVIKKSESGTTLIFTHHYTRELDDETYGTFNFNWGYYLRSLKQYCEEGRGFPFEA